MMDALPNIIPKSIIEVLENDEDNRYSWKLTRNQDSLSLTVRCKLPAKTPNRCTLFGGILALIIRDPWWVVLVLSIYLSLLVRSYMSITPGSANLEILIK